MTNSEKPAARPAPDPVRIGLMAAMLSALLPGAGHALLRDWARAGIWAVGWILVGSAGGGHTVALMALMAIAAIDAYVRARQLYGEPQEKTS